MAIETEIKIKINNHDELVKKLSALGAGYKGVIMQADSYFDNADSEMINLDSCLRLRSESDEKGNIKKTILCYKGPKLPGRVKARTEIETVLDKPDNMRHILKAIGYEISLSFNKKREIWLLDDCEVCLDTLPLLGCFIEIEGENEEKVVRAAGKLSLDLDDCERQSYACLVSEAIKLAGLPENEVYLEDALETSKHQTQTDVEQDGFGLVYMIINPKSGTGFAASITGKLDDYFRSKGLGVRINRIGEFSDIRRYIDLAKRSTDCVLVVVCGGDGTVREAAHNLLGSDKPLMVVPGGTENLLAHELGCDKNIETYIDMLERNSTVPLDLVRVNSEYFTSILGVGFDAEVVQRVSKNRTGNITHADYIWPLWRTFWAHRLPCFAVKADGKEIFRGEGMLFAGNIPRYATGMRILHDADLSDGLIDVCIYPCQSRWGILKHLLTALFRRKTKAAEAIYQKCRRADVIPLNDSLTTQIDGDPGPSLPLQIEVLPAAIRVYKVSNSTVTDRKRAGGVKEF